MAVQETTMLPIDKILSLTLHDDHGALPGLHKPLCPDHQPVSTADVSYVTGNRCERGLGGNKAEKRHSEPI